MYSVETQLILIALIIVLGLSLGRWVSNDPSMKKKDTDQDSKDNHSSANVNIKM